MKLEKNRTQMGKKEEYVLKGVDKKLCKENFRKEQSPPGRAKLLREEIVANAMHKRRGVLQAIPFLLYRIRVSKGS